MKKYDYAIISALTKSKLEKEVIRVLNMGYTLVGGIHVTGELEYFQAVTKEYEEKSK
ncbi:hypothetical protein LCGC14_2365030 [marine sediment metagenome]|uniref:Uncharacterized protein n=1 Tax=marine sediment metagenome TaxID=412755 RepID=A0A0F9C5D2_9ZZZZ